LQLNSVPADLSLPITMDGPAVRVPASGNTALGQNANLTFTATAGQRIVAQVTNVTNPSATVLLLKPDGTTQATLAISNSPAGQLFFMDTQTLATAGTYTLLVRHNGINVGNETLQLSSVPADFTAPITIGGGAVRVPASGNNALGQNASLTFSASSGQKISINITNATYTPYTSCYVTLINSQGSTLNTLLLRLRKPLRRHSNLEFHRYVYAVRRSTGPRHRNDYSATER
jgi:hypothetical protein